MTLVKSIFIIAVIATAQSVHAQYNFSKVETPLYRGSIINDKTSGIWEYFDSPGELSLKIDYDEGKILFITPDHSLFVIKSGLVGQEVVLDSPCRFHGSYAVLIEYYRSQFASSVGLLAHEPSSFRLMFEVDRDGVARNPEVVNDPGGNVRTKLLAAFDAAPNAWIPGTKNGANVSCLMAIDFNVCPTTPCNKRTYLPGQAKSLATINVGSGTLDSHEPPSDFLFQGLVWSPDDKKVFVQGAEINGLSATDFRSLENPGYIVDLESGESYDVPYSSIQRCAWLNNDQLLFNYDYPGLTERTAIFDLKDNKIIHGGDSTTRFHVVSHDGKKLAFQSYHNTENFTWEVDLASRQKRIIFRSPATQRIQPLAWSQDGMFLILNDKDTPNFDKQLKMVDSYTGAITDLPIPNSKPVGWLHDQKTVFLFKTERTQYETFGYFYKHAYAGTAQPQELIKKGKKITAVEKSPANHVFAILKRSDLYLVNQFPDDLFHPAIPNVYNFSWSHDGTRIAYLNALNQQMYVYDVVSKRSVQVSKWLIIKK